MKNIIEKLLKRRFLDNLTSDALIQKAAAPIKGYLGFDPTADSLHLGNLVGIVLLAHLQRQGHTPVVLIGGATGKIGDPSGKDQERPLLDLTTLEHNVASITAQLKQLLPDSRAVFVNNDEWYSKYSVTDFFRDVGKYFRLGPMLGKEMVRKRLQSDDGMSFTEFSYQLFQGYDFYHLFKNYGVTLQMGGSDQWGNIVSGVEAVRKMTGKTVYGATHPLLVRSDGKKFGKSEGGAVWLSKDKYSPYKFYQHLLQIPDKDAPALLRMLTFVPCSQIEEIERELAAGALPPLTAQRLLAEEVTRFVHQEEGLQTALFVTKSLSPGKDVVLDVEHLEKMIDDMPHAVCKREEVLHCSFAKVAVDLGLQPSRGEANRLLKNGGVYLNNKKMEDAKQLFSEQDLIGGKFLVLSLGKKRRFLVVVEKELV